MEVRAKWLLIGIAVIIKIPFILLNPNNSLIFGKYYRLLEAYSAPSRIYGGVSL